MKKALLHCSGVDESTKSSRRVDNQKRASDFVDSSTRFWPTNITSTRRLMYIDSLNRVCRLVDSILSTRRLDCIDLSTRFYRLVDSILSTHWINFIDSIVSTRLYRLVESILWTRRLDYIDTSTRLYRLVDSIVSTHWIDFIDSSTRLHWLVDSIVSIRWLDCIDSSTRLHRLVNSILSTCRLSDIDSSNRWNGESTNQCNGFVPNTIESMKQCNWVDGMIQRSRLIVNHKCEKKLWVNRVDESMSRRVDTIESTSRRPKKSERPSRRYNAIGVIIRLIFKNLYEILLYLDVNSKKD